jgi:hypothetical protein
VGRWVLEGNSSSHTVKIVDAATGLDLPGGWATVNTAGAPAGSFRYADLPSPITLQAGATYYMVSSETAGGDTWYDYDTRLVTTSAAVDVGVVYGIGTRTQRWSPGGSPGNGYVPVNILYR